MASFVVQWVVKNWSAVLFANIIFSFYCISYVYVGNQMLNIFPGLVPAETPSPSLPLVKDWESRELWNPATSCTRLFFYIWLIYVKTAAICTCFFST